MDLDLETEPSGPYQGGGPYNLMVQSLLGCAALLL